MKSDNDILVIFMLMMTIIVMSFSLSAMHDILNIKDQQLQEQIEAQDKRIAEMEKEITYQIDIIQEDIFDVEERLDEDELRLDDHMYAITRHDILIKQLQAKTPTPTPTPKASNKHKVSVRLSENDIQLIAKLVYEEAGAQSYKCQKAVASVVINRMVRYKMTARQVVYEPGVFTVAGGLMSTKASATSIKAVRDVVKNGTTLPKNVLAFRNGHYHSFGKPYCHIDGVYFSKM